MTESIPKSLQYGCQNSQARVVRQTVQPQGVSTGSTSQQTTFRFKLPEKSLIDLKSLAFYYDYTVSGLTDAATNYSNALLPAAYKHFSSVKFYVSGAVAANGMANHYDMAYHALARASASEDWVNSRWNNGLAETMIGGDAIGTQDITAQPQGYVSRTAHFTYDDLLGLPNSKNFVLDTSLFGTCEVELTMTANTAIKAFHAGTVTAGALSASLVGSISGIKAMVDTVVSVSPLYVSLLAERLQVDTPIRLPFQSIATSVVSNSGNNRITLNSSCVDAIVVCPLAADPNTFLPFSGAGLAAQNTLNSARYRFNSSRSIADANTGLFQIQVGSEVFPRQPLRIDECADLTVNSIYGNSAQSRNMLFAGLAAGVQAYSRLAYLAENCIVIQKFMLGEEGWATGLLSGINCSGVSTDFVVSTSNLGSHLFIAALMTSQLVFNPATSSVSIEQ
jgi:hypothetical protein